MSDIFKISDTSHPAVSWTLSIFTDTSKYYTMAALIGFGVPLLFSLIFFFINKSHAPTNKVLLFAALLYVASVGLGIGATITFGGGAIFAGLVFPILLLIVLSMVVRK